MYSYKISSQLCIKGTIEEHPETLDYIFNIYMKAAYRGRNHWNVNIDNHSISFSSKFNPDVVGDVLKEVSNEDEVIYKFENGKVVTITDEFKSEFDYYSKIISNIEEYAEEQIRYRSTYEIIYKEKYWHKDTYDSSNDTITLSSLDEFKKKILKESNYDKNSLSIPTLNSADDIKEDSFWCRGFMLGNTKKVVMIKRKCEDIFFGIGVRYSLPNDGEGCVYSNGELTNGIKHCSDYIKEWFNNFNKDLENIDEIAVKNWNFIK